MNCTFEITNIGCFGVLNGIVLVTSNENMVIKDLYSIFDDALNIAYEEKSCSTRFFRVKVDGKMRDVVEEFNLEKFVKVNKLNQNSIEIEYGYGGIGETEMLDGRLKLQIRPLEGCHIKNLMYMFLWIKAKIMYQ